MMKATHYTDEKSAEQIRRTGVFKPSNGWYGKGLYAYVRKVKRHEGKGNVPVTFDVSHLKLSDTCRPPELSQKQWDALRNKSNSAVDKVLQRFGYDGEIDETSGWVRIYPNSLKKIKPDASSIACIIAELRSLAKRSHPELNPVKSVVEQLEPYSNRDDIYITFTEIEKVGINPHTKYATPAGIYCYPLKVYWAQVKKQGLGAFPFAAHQPFVYVLQGKMVDVSKISYDKYDKKLRSYEPLMKDIIEEYGTKIFVNDANKWLPVAEIGYGRTRYIADYDDIERTAEQERYKSVSGEKLWIATNILAMVLSIDGSNTAFKWNKILRELGFKGISDKQGLGIIHPNEPTQAVFLTKAGFRVVDEIRNVKHFDPTKDINQAYIELLKVATLVKRTISSLKKIARVTHPNISLPIIKESAKNDNDEQPLYVYFPYYLETFKKEDEIEKALDASAKSSGFKKVKPSVKPEYTGIGALNNFVRSGIAYERKDFIVFFVLRRDDTGLTPLVTLFTYSVFKRAFK